MTKHSRINFAFLCYFLFSCMTAWSVPYPNNRLPSIPLVSGDSFRAYADYVFDELDSSLDPAAIKPGSTIFVKGDYLNRFFTTIHPYIPCKYIMISHNSDDPAPGAYYAFLNDDKLIAWFAQNMDASHPKLHPIPIGLANRCWSHGNTEMVQRIAAKQARFSKQHLVYLNFAIDTFYSERSLVHQLFSRAPFCLHSRPKDFQSYLADLCTTKFVLSPRGNGLDTHRLWEALYIRAIPVVKASTLDPVYEGLPVLVVQDWNCVTEDFLNSQYEEMQQKSYSFEKLTTDYWFRLIDSFKTQF